MARVELKPIADVKAKLREVLHRAAQRYVRAGLDPKPENCEHAPKIGNKVQRCAGCGANPGESCKADFQFKSRYTFDELKLMFRELCVNREWLLRNHRDAAMLLWVLNQLNPQEEPEPEPLPDEGPPEAWIRLEGDTLKLSPAAVPIITALLNNLSTLLPQDSPNGQAMDGRALGDEPPAPPR